jgi:hypothetical protein
MQRMEGAQDELDGGRSGDDEVIVECMLNVNGSKR